MPQMPQQLNLSMENKLFLYGASGHCKVIIDIVQSNGAHIEAIVDDFPKTDFLLGIPVIMSEELIGSGSFIIAIGNNKTRKKIADCNTGVFENAFHATAILSPFSTIGKGTVIMAGVVVNPNAIIGHHCILNTGAIIEHDATIADFVHISPGVALAGNVTIGEGSHVGIGATVIQGITIGKWVTIGAGTVIIKDIPDYAVVVGNPGKIIKYNNENE
jgi:sugar O-acyltransferase (sialic acid O-acetyltransferase NeuD family)